jgi:hypothetical protein
MTLRISRLAFAGNPASVHPDCERGLADLQISGGSYRIGPGRSRGISQPTNGKVVIYGPSHRGSDHFAGSEADRGGYCASKKLWVLASHLRTLDRQELATAVQWVDTEPVSIFCASDRWINK